MSSQRKSYPGCVELLLWKAAWSDGDLEFFFDTVLSAFPMLVEPGREFGISGKGWQRFVPTEKLGDNLKRKGVDSLQSMIFRELSPPLDVRIDRDNQSCSRLNISCSKADWESAGGDVFLNLLLSGLQVDYGHFNHTKYFNIDHFHRIAASPTFGGNSIDPWGPPANNKLLPASEYEKLLEIWEHERGVGCNQPSEIVARPLMVYPVSILTRAHLDLPVSGMQSLSEWIRDDADRGTIREVNPANFVWKVGDDQIQATTRALWSLGFFNASEYFEIADWDTELQLPRLRHIKQYESLENN